MEVPAITEKQKNKRIRDGVMDMYRQFVSEVDPKNVLDLLIEKRVISIEQKEEFMIKVTRKERCRALLDHLLYSSNDESFIVLRDALEDQYHWIVERIDQCVTENEAAHILDPRYFQSKMTQTEQKQQLQDPAHMNLPFDVEERLRKETESMKIEFEIECKNLKQNLEDSRKETAEMTEQYRILNDYLGQSLDREIKIKKELDAIKSTAKSEIRDKEICGNMQEATAQRSNETEENPSASPSYTDTNNSVVERFTRKLSPLSSCCICSMTLQNNRMTPCFHIVCLNCLKKIQRTSIKQPGDVLPCPSCGKTFAIPSEGMKGLQKNLFAKSPTDIERLFDLENKSRTCKTHSEKVLDYYCKECDTVACVSCFVENHKFHDCKDVTTIDKDFRLTLEETTKHLSRQKQEMLSRRLDMEILMKEFLAKSLETSKDIKKKSEILKSLIEDHEHILLGELSTIEQKHHGNMEREVDDIERNTENLDSFVTYCTQMKVKGSASDVCSCACNLITTSEELSKETEEYLLSPSKSVEIKFISTYQDEILHIGKNVIGKLSESSNSFDSTVIVFGIDDNVALTTDVIKIYLNQSVDVSKEGQIPVEMIRGSSAAVLCDSIFVTGIGEKCDEIWSFNVTSSIWKKCASLVQGRIAHSIAFVDQVLYICGGFLCYDKKTLDDVEAYDTLKDQCVSVGKLTFAVFGFSNCLPFKSSLYIFGGLDANDKIVNEVQVYDTKLNTCTLLSTPIPGARCLLRAVLWGNTVILLGYDGCFTYNFETQVWQVRHYFKTDSNDFGLVISNGLVFVIGGGERKEDADGKIKWICRDDVRCIPLVNILKNEPIDWRHHATLPKPSFVYAFGKMDFALR